MHPWQKFVGKAPALPNVFDNMSITKTFQSGLSKPSIRDDRGAFYDGVLDEGHQLFRGSLIDSSESNTASRSPPALSCDHHQHFVLSFATMYVLFWVPDEGFVHFHSTADAIPPRRTMARRIL